MITSPHLCLVQTIISFLGTGLWGEAVGWGPQQSQSPALLPGPFLRDSWAPCEVWY